MAARSVELSCDNVQSPKSTRAFADFGRVNFRDSESRTVRNVWQEYAHGLNGQEPWREQERSGQKWSQDPIDPKTGKRGHTLRHFWSRRLPIFRFIEMRIAMGDSEVVALETCQEIVNKNLTRIGFPLLRDVVRQDEENDIVSTNTRALITGQRIASRGC
jgi:hypothetical protein